MDEIPQIELFDTVGFCDFPDTTVCEFTGKRTIDCSHDNFVVLLKKCNEVFTVINRIATMVEM